MGAALAIAVFAAPARAEDPVQIAMTFDPEPDQVAKPVVHHDPRPEPRDHGDHLRRTAVAIAFSGGASTTRIDAYGLDVATGFDEPAPLIGKRLRLDGFGSMVGGSMRAFVQSGGGVRGGLGAGIHYLGGVDLLHEPLADGVSISLDAPWMASFELFVGKAFAAGPVAPYFDLKGVLQFVTATVELSASPYGFVGSTQYMVPSFTLAPRIGVLVPLGETFFIDIEAHQGLFGVERSGASAGLGALVEL